jgi:hypothetical protein
MPQLFERTINLPIDEAYKDLKSALVEKGCKITSEETPKRIITKQGSLWGTTPKTAKKNLEFQLSTDNNETKITATSRLSSDWKNITFIGVILAAILVSVCGWIAIDLSNFLATNKATVWSWLVTIHGTVNTTVAEAFVNLTKTLAVFLSVIIVFEIVVAYYANVKVDGFAEEALDSIMQKNKNAS